MTSKLAAAVVVFGVVLAIAGAWILLSKFRESGDLQRGWLTIGTSALTMAAVTISLGGFVFTMLMESRRGVRSREAEERERTLRERVSWRLIVSHDIRKGDLDITIRCLKTADTIEPKSVNLTVRVHYLNEYGVYSPSPPAMAFDDIQLTPVSPRELEWRLENVQDVFGGFRDPEGRVVSAEVLARPLELSFDINYNLLFAAAARAQLPRAIEGTSSLKEAQFEPIQKTRN